MNGDDTPTGDRARALFAEWTQDYAAAKDRDEHGEFAATLQGGTGPPAMTGDQLRAEFHDIGQQLDPGLLAVLESHGVAPGVRRAVRDYLGDVLKGIARVEAVAVWDAERDLGRER